jgi:hypothetical protein
MFFLYETSPAIAVIGVTPPPGQLFSKQKEKAATLVMFHPAASYEEVIGVDACTVAALDVITAFAVPNLSGFS